MARAVNSDPYGSHWALYSGKVRGFQSSGLAVGFITLLEAVCCPVRNTEQMALWADSIKLLGFLLSLPGICGQIVKRSHPRNLVLQPWSWLIVPPSSGSVPSDYLPRCCQLHRCVGWCSDLLSAAEGLAVQADSCKKSAAVLL